MRFLPLSILFYISLVMASFGEETHNIVLDDCQQKTSENEVLACFNRNYLITTVDLSNSYEKAAARVKLIDETNGTNDAFSALEDSQQAWILHRNKTCKSYGEIGTNAVIKKPETAECLIRLTLERTKSLSKLYSK
ncbi:lysozyme inhibitor LprI family protein [Flexibacterium corallicola]|uniref:lysozyme inhibitor LprI family protein n=1 Tax=Flexibacterium corallicola TaxID=3037259 RepID=UPI00286F9319|nr:lysozyme inhibitor LprI family protein [Pseudovibrio sp. M1P-2-3]